MCMPLHWCRGDGSALGPVAAEMLTARGFPSKVLEQFPTWNPSYRLLVLAGADVQNLTVCANRMDAQVRSADEEEGVGSEQRSAAAAEARAAEARKADLALGLAWGLAAVSLAHHAGHMLHLLVSRVLLCVRLRSMRAAALSCACMHTVTACSIIWLWCAPTVFCSLSSLKTVAGRR